MNRIKVNTDSRGCRHRLLAYRSDRSIVIEKTEENAP